MAHIGNPAAVALRRDFNLNVFNNNDGFARRYFCTWNNLPPGVANTLNGVTFEIGPDTSPNDFNIDWISPFIAAPVFQYRTELLVGIAPAGNLTKRFSIISKTGGIIFIGDYPIDNDAKYPTFPIHVALEVVFWSTAWFDREPIAAEVRMVKKTWSDPPPH